MSEAALTLLVNFVCSLAETGFILLFHSAFLGVDDRRPAAGKYPAIWGASLVLFVLVVFVPLPTVLRYLLVFGFYLFYASFYSGSWPQKLLSTLAGFFTFMALGTSLLWVEALVSRSALQDVYASLLLALVNEGVLLTVGLLLATAGRGRRRQQPGSRLRWGAYPTLPGVGAGRDALAVAVFAAAPGGAHPAV